LKKLLERKDKDLEIVQWYIEVLEGGFDTKNILKDFVKAQEDIKELTNRAA